jgi:hypothetical protein
MARPVCFESPGSDLRLVSTALAQEVSATGDEARRAQNRHEVGASLEKPKSRNVALHKVFV